MEPAIKFLLDYVDKHFAHEENLQKKKKSNYPNQKTYFEFHENYKRKLREVAGQIPAAGPSVSDLAKLNSHIAVLISHIRIEDKNLGTFLKTTA